MIIPITVAAGPTSRPLPPQFAQFGTDEVVLIEMQGALEVEGNSSGQYVGKLTVDPETVSCGHACMSTGHSHAFTLLLAEEVYSAHWTPPAGGETRKSAEASGRYATTTKYVVRRGKKPHRRGDTDGQ
jgi:hypothetical protein